MSIEHSAMTTAAMSLRVVELRRYATVPRRRDTLIALFEREFVPAQLAHGCVPIGHFRDLDDPDAFPWFRGFDSMETRRSALDAFYTSPVWMRNRDAANATMLDSENVLLLRNARPDSGFARTQPARAGERARGEAAGFVAVSVLMLDAPSDDAFVTAFEQTVLPDLRAHADRIAYLVTEERPNDFPRLPVREAEFAFVAAGVCRTLEALDRWCSAFDVARLPDVMRTHVTAVESHRLEPAQGSLFP